MKKHFSNLALLIVGFSVWHLQAPVEFDDNSNRIITTVFDDPANQEHGRLNVPIGDRVLPNVYHPDQGTVEPGSTSQQSPNTPTIVTALVRVEPATEFPVVRPTGAQQIEVTDVLADGS